MLNTKSSWHIFSHGVFLTWDLEQSIQQTASMVTPEKRTGKVRGRGDGRVETSLDDYGVPQDCIVGSPPSRWGKNHIDFMIFIIVHPVTGLL